MLSPPCSTGVLRVLGPRRSTRRPPGSSPTPPRLGRIRGADAPRTPATPGSRAASMERGRAAALFEDGPGRDPPGKKFIPKFRYKRAYQTQSWAASYDQPGKLRRAPSTRCGIRCSTTRSSGADQAAARAQGRLNGLGFSTHKSGVAAFARPRWSARSGAQAGLWEPWGKVPGASEKTGKGQRSSPAPPSNGQGPTRRPWAQRGRNSLRHSR